uniref:Uncharacterized protein n=1 Tax=Oryza sativa subsp. japonica TaxID=39947 RepID=Q69TN9_ORYSJ|nr:hypothetical protein [Oryza sativa Japonica Group]BAD35788.1 hypothetical protein [Oryza sativa Japonica Group]
MVDCEHMVLKVVLMTIKDREKSVGVAGESMPLVFEGMNPYKERLENMMARFDEIWGDVPKKIGQISERSNTRKQGIFLKD